MRRTYQCTYVTHVISVKSEQQLAINETKVRDITHERFSIIDPVVTR